MTSAHDTLVIPLKRPNMWTGGLVAATMMVTIISLSTGYELLTRIAPSLHSWRDVLSSGLGELFFGWSILVSALLAVIFKRVIVRLRPMPPLVLDETGIALPVHAETWRVHHVPYQKILSVIVTGTIAGRPNPSHVQIETSTRLYVLPLMSLGEMDALTRVLDGLRTRILALPNGEDTFAAMQQQREAAARLFQRSPTVMQIIMGLEIVFFANQYFTDSLRTPMGAIGWGANVPVLVQSGEYFRILVANFLHSSLPELMLMLVALYYLGAMLERMIGHARAAIILGLSALAASSVTAFTASGLMYMGAWGGVFGLLGTHAVLNRQCHDRMPPGFRQPLFFWLRAAVMAALLLVFFPNIAWQGMLAGAAMGAGVMALFLQRKQDIPMDKPHVAINPLAIGIASVYAIGLAIAVQFAAKIDVTREATLGEKIVHAEKTKAEDLNMLAWLWSTDDKTPQPLLQLAEDAAERAASMASEAEYTDTLANVKFRLDQFDNAIALEHSILHADPDNTFYATQLARFIIGKQRHNRNADIKNDNTQTTHVDTLTWADVPNSTPRKTQLQLTLGTPPPGGQHVYAAAVIADQSEPILLVRADVHAGSPTQLAHEFTSQALMLPPETTLTWYTLRLPVTQREQLASATPPQEVPWRTWIMSPLLTQLALQR